MIRLAYLLQWGDIMAWENIYNTDGGMVTALYESSLAEVPQSAIHIDQDGTQGNLNSGEVRGTDYFDNSDLAIMPLTAVIETGWKNIAMFKLYNKSDGEFHGKWLVFRINVTQSRPIDLQWMGYGGFYLYDGSQYVGLSYDTTNYFGLWSTGGYTNTTKIFFHTENYIENDNTYLRIYMGTHCKVDFDPFMCVSYGRVLTFNHPLLNDYDSKIEPIYISPEFGPAAEEDGYGPTTPGHGGGSGGPGPTFDSESDPWTPTPVKPGVLTFGLLNIYKCDTGALANLGRELFPEITWPPSTGFSDLIEWLGNVIQAFSDSVWNKGLIDYIISVHLIPVKVTGGALEDIKIGPRTMTGILARPINADVIEIDCGSIHIDEFYTSYIDYMTVCRIYIPYFGMVTIRPEYWQSATLRLKYLWNVIDGSFIAQLFSTITRHQKPCTTMIGQYSGSACVHMPLSGANYANMFSTLAGAAGGIAAGAAAGNVAAVATSALSLPSAVNGDMMMGNAYNASSAFYGHSKPFVIIERPVSHFSPNYPTEKGLPLLTRMKIGGCRGFTQAEDIILDGIPCTQAEKEKIRALFKNGVIIK